LVPPTRIELVMTGYQPIVIPFNYRGIHWCTNLELNQDSTDYESTALPLSYWCINLVEYPGIEPGMPEGGGFTVHCITIDASTPYLVDAVRFELTKPCGNRVTAGSDTPTSTAHPILFKHTVCDISVLASSMCILKQTVSFPLLELPMHDPVIQYVLI
jgi:hypothetical protein